MATKKLTKTGGTSWSRLLVDKVDLLAIGLDAMSAKLDRSNYASAYAGDRKRITRRLENACTVSDYSKEHFDVTAMLSLRVEAAGFEDPILALHIAVSGHFHPKKVLSREEADEFAKAEARLIFWPYLRQIVSDTTGRMHIAPITLPLVANEGGAGQRKRK